MRKTLELRIFMHALRIDLLIPGLIRELKHSNSNMRHLRLTSKGSLFFRHPVCMQWCILMAWWKRRSAEYGVRSAEYGVRSTEYGVRSTECGVRSTECGVCLKRVSLDLAVIFKQTPSFPLYGGIKWKTRSLS